MPTKEIVDAFSSLPFVSKRAKAYTPSASLVYAPWPNATARNPAIDPYTPKLTAISVTNATNEERTVALRPEPTALAPTTKGLT